MRSHSQLRKAGIRTLTALGTGVILLTMSGCSARNAARTPSYSTPQVIYSEAKPRSDSGFVAIGDSVVLTVWGYPEFASRQVVKESGMITIPLVGDEPAAGSRKDELINRVRRRLSELVKEDVRVSLVIIPPSAKVTILGAIARPGSYPSGLELPLLEVLATAGGWTQQSDLRYVKIARARPPTADSTVIEVDIQDAIDTGMIASLPPVHPGDTIIIPERENVLGAFTEFLTGAFVLTYVFTLVGR